MNWFKSFLVIAPFLLLLVVVWAPLVMRGRLYKAARTRLLLRLRFITTAFRSRS